MTDIDKTDSGWRASRWRITAWSSAALVVMLILLVDDVDWETGVVIILGIFLVTPAVLHELASRYSGERAFKLALTLAIGATLLLLWVNGAVGIIGDDDNPANMIYLAIPAVVLIGAVIARLKPHGMKRTLYLAAAAQVLVFGIALAAGWGFTGPITVFFVGMWLSSATLFRKAATDSVADAAA